MPGQNDLWDKYGCEISNDYEMLVLEVNFSSGDSKSSFQSWCNQYGVKYPAVCATEGGSQFNTALQNNNYGGPKYLIYPDRTFKKSPTQSDYDAAGLVAHVHDVEKFTLTVTSGSGDGDLAEGASATITADAAPTGKEFDKWTGDIQYLADPNSSTTTVTMPAQDVTVTATYKDKEPVTKKDNYQSIATWESGMDTLGSSITIDSSQQSDTVITASIKLGNSDETNKNWAWAQITGYTDGDFAAVTSITLTYYSDRSVYISLDQDGLSEDGASHQHLLPAASRGQVKLTLNDFAQPDWVATDSPELVADLDMTKVKSISFSAIDEGATTNLELQGIYLEGFKESTPVIQAVNSVKNNNLKIISLSAGKLVISGAKKDMYDISIFNVSGKKVFSDKHELSGNAIVDFKNSNLVNGAYVVKINSNNVSVVSSQIIQ